MTTDQKHAADACREIDTRFCKAYSDAVSCSSASAEPIELMHDAFADLLRLHRSIMRAAAQAGKATRTQQPVELSLVPRNDRICHYERTLSAFVNRLGYCNIRGAAEKLVELEERAGQPDKAADALAADGLSVLEDIQAIRNVAGDIDIGYFQNSEGIVRKRGNIDGIVTRACERLEAAWNARTHTDTAYAKPHNQQLYAEPYANPDRAEVVTLVEAYGRAVRNHEASQFGSSYNVRDDYKTRMDNAENKLLAVLSAMPTRDDSGLVEALAKALEPFAEMLSGFKSWYMPGGILPTKTAYPDHLPVCRVTWPADKESQNFREIYVSDFEAAGKALARYKASKGAV